MKRIIVTLTAVLLFSFTTFGMSNGWVQEGNDWFYYDLKGKKVVDGWVEGYYLNYEGIMAKGTGNGYGTTVTLDRSDMETSITECLQGSRVSMNFFKKDKTNEKVIYHVVDPTGADTNGETEWNSSDKEYMLSLDRMVTTVGTFRYFLTDIYGNILIDNVFTVVPNVNYQPYVKQEVHSEWQALQNLQNDLNTNTMFIQKSEMRKKDHGKRKDDEWKEFMYELGHDDDELNGEYTFR